MFGLSARPDVAVDHLQQGHLRDRGKAPQVRPELGMTRLLSFSLTNL